MNPEMRSGKRTIPWSTSYPPLWQSQGRTRIHEERHSQLWLFCTSWAPMVIVSIAPYFFKLHSVLSNCKSMVFVTYEFLFLLLQLLYSYYCCFILSRSKWYICMSFKCSKDVRIRHTFIIYICMESDSDWWGCCFVIYHI